jgi:pimeloyl-ACP methyl ester carboxylesterase
MMCDARLFAPQIAVLSGSRAIHLAPVSGHDSMEDLAAAVLLHAPPRFDLAGLSMGGIVAMEMIARAPARIASLALLDTNPRAEAPELAAGRQPQMDRVRAGGLREVIRDEMTPNYLASGPGSEAVLQLCMEMALALGPEVFIRQSAALRDRPDQQETLKSVRVPTLILCGADDRLCPIQRHWLMHRLIPNSTLTVIDGAGHLPTLEQPEPTTAALCRWLRQ